MARESTFISVNKDYILSLAAFLLQWQSAKWLCQRLYGAGLNLLPTVSNTAEHRFR